MHCATDLANGINFRKPSGEELNAAPKRRVFENPDRVSNHSVDYPSGTLPINKVSVITYVQIQTTSIAYSIGFTKISWSTKGLVQSATAH